jgi:hypothetical protein
LLDEMYLGLIVEQLGREPGLDVMSMEAHRGLDDLAVMELAAQEQRVLVTENAPDFVKLARSWIAEQREFAGLIFTSDKAFPRGKQSTVGELVQALRALAARWPGHPNHDVWLQRAKSSERR